MHRNTEEDHLNYKALADSSDAESIGAVSQVESSEISAGKPSPSAKVWA